MSRRFFSRSVEKVFRQVCRQTLVLHFQVVDTCQPILLFNQDHFAVIAALANVLEGGEQTIKTLLDITAQLNPEVTQGA